MSAPKMSAVALALGVAVLAASPASAREKIAEIDGLAEQKPAASSLAVEVEPIAVGKVAEVSALKAETLSVPTGSVLSVSAVSQEKATVGTNPVASVNAISEETLAVATNSVASVRPVSSETQSVGTNAVAKVEAIAKSSESVGTNAVAETKAIAADKTTLLPVVVSDVKSIDSVVRVDSAKLNDVKAAKKADPFLDAIVRFEIFRPGCMTRAWAVQQMGISADKRGDSAEADRLFDRYMGMMENSAE